jgi:hypothetical protein
VHYTTKVPKLVSRQFDDEIVLANFETGIYYSLIGTAGDIWLGVESGATVDEIVAALVAIEKQGAVDVEQQVTGFIDQLLAEKIIAPSPDAPTRKPWSPQFSNPFSPPVLDQFDDLRDLLFLDPVHDVGEAGWPVRASDDV